MDGQTHFGRSRAATCFEESVESVASGSAEAYVAAREHRTDEAHTSPGEHRAGI